MTARLEWNPESELARLASLRTYRADCDRASECAAPATTAAGVCGFARLWVLDSSRTKELKDVEAESFEPTVSALATGGVASRAPCCGAPLASESDVKAFGVKGR